MNSNFEIVHKHGASAFVIYTFIKENPKATALDIEIELGLSYACVQTTLTKLIQDKLLQRDKMFLKRCRGYRYTTIIQ